MTIPQSEQSRGTTSAKNARVLGQPRGDEIDEILLGTLLGDGFRDRYEPEVIESYLGDVAEAKAALIKLLKDEHERGYQDGLQHR